MHAIPADADRLLVVLSDIEMGAGGVTDDFPQSEHLGELIQSYNQPPFDGIAVDLIFNGDTFDFLKLPVDGDYPRHISPQIALAKLRQVADAHPAFFEAVRRFLALERPKRRVHFIAGNHDPELLFPEVRHALRDLIGSPRQLFFPGFELEIGQVHIEHGSQADEMFRIDPELPVLDLPEGRVLNLSWGALGLLEVAIPLYSQLYHLDRVKPSETLFRVMPEAKELLIARSWQYWTRDYLKKLLSEDDPVRRITWKMIREIGYRFASADMSVSFDNHFRRALKSSESHRLYVVGHTHDAGWWSYGDRKLLQTGCFRNEYMLDRHGLKQTPIPNVYAEVYLDGDVICRSHLVELAPAPTPPGYLPVSLLAFLAPVKALLGSEQERENAEAARKAREAADKSAA